MQLHSEGTEPFRIEGGEGPIEQAHVAVTDLARNIPRILLNSMPDPEQAVPCRLLYTCCVSDLHLARHGEGGKMSLTFVHVGSQGLLEQCLYNRGKGARLL